MDPPHYQKEAQARCGLATDPAAGHRSVAPVRAERERDVTSEATARERSPDQTEGRPDARRAPARIWIGGHPQKSHSNGSPYGGGLSSPSNVTMHESFGHVFDYRKFARGGYRRRLRVKEARAGRGAQ